MKKLFTLKSSSITNRILITLLLCFTVGSQCLWAQAHYKVYANNKSSVASNAATQVNIPVPNVNMGSNANHGYNQGNFTLICTGNVQSASFSGNFDQNSINGAKINVTYNTTDNNEKGGAIIVKYNWNWDEYDDFHVITIPYKKHVWDFTEQLNPNLVQDGNTYGYSFRSIAQNGNTKNGPVAYVKSAINQDNAFYINETAGLLFTTPANSFGRNLTGPKNQDYTYNDITGCKTIAYKGNGDNENTKLVIPQVPAGYYVKMYWHQYDAGYGSDYTMTNLKDLEGNAIVTSHKLRIPGCPTNTDGDYYGYGTTTFQVQNTGDVTFNLRDLGWATLYKIEITSDYSSDMQLKQYPSMNESTGALSGTPTIVGINTDAGHIVTIGNTPAVRYYSGVVGDAHGLAAMSPEITFEVDEPNKKNSTSISAEAKNWTSNGGVTYTNYKLTVTPKYGIVKATQRINITYPNQNYKYVLDKKENYIAVGHVDPQTYPYTWEFTSYNMNDDHCGWGMLYSFLTGTGTNPPYEGSIVTNGLEHYGQYRLWEGEQGAPAPKGYYTMFTANNVSGSLGTTLLKPLFAQGSQLAYRSGQGDMNDAEEFQGLGVTVEGIATDKYGIVTGLGHGWLSGVTELLIPDVDPGMAVYIQTETASTKPYFEIEGGGTITTDAAALGEGATLIEKKWVVDGTEVVDGKVKEIGHHEDDNISTYVLGAIITPTSGNKAHVRVKGLDPTKRIFRIGVTNIRKDINQFGYATESRDRKIDHMMTGFLTKADAHAYFAENFTAYENVETGQDPIGIVKMVPAVKIEEVSIDRAGNKVKQNYENIPENTGVVLYADNVSSAINVPLFVPAIHVKPSPVSDNLLVGPVTSKYIDGTAKDYILTNIYQHRQNLNVNLEGSGTEGKIGFYRAQPGTLGANKAYLNLDNVASSSAKLVLFSFFDDEEEDIHNGITTGIEDATHQMDNGQWTKDNAEWYNLNGQKLNGMPSSSGLYIVNGKKVLVK